MSNQANTPAQAATKGFDVEKMKDDEILKLEAEMKQKLELLQKAKADREVKIKEASLTSIKVAIDKVITEGVVTTSEITAFLVENGYVVAPKAAATGASTGKGRRSISDEDVLFSFAYSGEGGRNQTLKLDAESKLPAAVSAAAKTLKELQTKTFEELKAHFTPKFFEFAKTDESFVWVERFFPKIQSAVDEMVKAK